MVRQAIVTKYLGPTNYRGARVRATAQAGTLVMSWDDALDVNDNHETAARALVDKYGWLERNTLVGGGLPSNSGNCYVLVERKGV